MDLKNHGVSNMDPTKHGVSNMDLTKLEVSKHGPDKIWCKQTWTQQNME